MLIIFEKYLGYIPEHLDIAKLLLSILVGGIIGLEREYRSKSAGFRTIILICIGSTLFTIFSIQLGGTNSPDRMAANIITGIGFLGAGAIFKDINNSTRGLNTATIIWIAAALGVGIGTGHFILTILTTAILMVILVGFPHFERIIALQHQIRAYKICLTDNTQIEEMEKLFINCKLKPSRVKHVKTHGSITCNWTAGGKEEDHKLFTDLLFENENIAEFEF